MRREWCDGSLLRAQGRFFGVRISEIDGTAVLRVDNGMPQEVSIAGFVPTTVADRPAERVDVSGVACRVELAETMHEAFLLVSTPPQVREPHWAETVAVIAGGEIVGAPQEWLFVKPSWATKAHLIYTLGASVGGSGATAFRIYERTLSGIELPSNIDETAGTGQAPDFSARMNTLAAWGMGLAPPIGAGYGPPPASMRIRLEASASRVIAGGYLVARWAR